MYESGNRQPSAFFDDPQMKFLQSIGHNAQELFDFAEDYCRGKDPTFETALLIAAVRRDYFLVIQHGKHSSRVVSMDTLPSKEAAVDGFIWLPRLLPKARAKLRGEMPADLMYDCGGDRAFFKRVNIHPADFLREVWAAGDDDRRIIEYVKRAAK